VKTWLHTSAGRRTVLVAIGIIFVAVLFYPIYPTRRLSDSAFGAWATALQTVGVVATLLLAVEQLRIAAIALRNDTYDRRVDRVYQLHQELTSGSLDAGRRRLVDHLKSHRDTNNKIIRLSKAQLRDDPIYNSYITSPTLLGAASPPSPISTPIKDLGALLRFFERARVLQLSGSADTPVFLELIGRHSAWFTCAIKLGNSNTRRALKALGSWADDEADSLKYDDRYPYLREWGVTRTNDFYNMKPWAGESEEDDG
jgi:hypothetical protein